MTWFKVDDELYLHPKTMQAGNAAMGLWVRAGAYSMAKLTEGFVSIEVVRSIGSTKLADKLVTAGLWSKVPGGYAFHQWHGDPVSGAKRQPTAEEVLASKESARLRQAAWRKNHRKSDGTFGPTNRSPLDEPPDDE